MANDRSLYTFHAFQPYLQLLNAYNLDNFQAPFDVRRVATNVFGAFCETMLLIAAGLVLALGYWHCVDTNFQMGILSTTMPVLMTIVQIIFAHLSLVAKSRLVTATVAQLGAIVIERERSIYVCVDYLWCHTVYRSNFFFTIWRPPFLSRLCSVSGVISNLSAN